jgi:hypothetical protein
MGVHSAYQSQFHAEDSYASEVEDIRDIDDSDFESDHNDGDFLGNGDHDETAKEDGQADHVDDFEDRAVSCFRFFVLFLLVAGIITAGVTSWKFLKNEEYEDFEHGQ